MNLRKCAKELEGVLNRSESHEGRIAAGLPDPRETARSIHRQAGQLAGVTGAETVYCQTPDCEAEAGCTLTRNDGAELQLCAVCAGAFEMGRRAGGLWTAPVATAEVTGYTPGPWRASDGAILTDTLNDYGNFIVVECQRERTAQDEANLRLIATAPDLLDALREMSARSAVRRGAKTHEKH